MVAVSQDFLEPVDSGSSAVRRPRPVAAGVGSMASRRAVVVVVDVMDLLRPQSDLVRILAMFDVVDVLVATQCSSATDLDDDDLDDDHDECPGRLAGLELERVNLCRLGLRAPLAPTAEHDLVAAMSELVGFDPEPGVYCIAPSLGGDQTREVVNRAAHRIVQVYGLPLLRYRNLELSVVGADSSG